MPPKATKKEDGGQPKWWNPEWPARSVEYKLSVVATFHPSAGATSLSMPWLDASGQAAGAAVSSGPFSSFEADESKSSPHRRFPGAVTARMEKSLGSLAVTADFILGIQKACLPISVTLGAEPDSNAGGVCRIHPGPLLLANDGEDSSLPRRPSEVFASLTETIGLAGIYKLEVKISTQDPILSTDMLRRLMPACFTVEMVRGLPNELWLTTEAEDVHVEVYPQSTSIHTKKVAEECHRNKSIKRPHNTFLKFSEPTVWLLGSSPVHVVREWLQSEALVVEIHDRDLHKSGEVVPITDDMDEKQKAEAERKRKRIEDRQHPHGVARFKLAPLLSSAGLTSGLRSDVFPARGNNKKLRAETAQDLTAADVLGENGREIIAEAGSVGKTEVAPEYLSSGTFCTVRATLSVPLKKAKHLQAEDEDAEGIDLASKEVRDGESNIWMYDKPEDEPLSPKSKKGAKDGKRGSQEVGLPPPPDLRVASTKRCRAKITHSAGEGEEEQEIHGPWRATREEAEKDEEHLLSVKEQHGTEVEKVHKAAAVLKGKNSLGVDLRFERYGRVVIVSDDNDTETNKAVINTCRLQNAAVLGINPDSADMLTREFHEDERANPHLDVLTGFSVLDGKCRLMVIEGLRDYGLKRLLEAVPRNKQANHKDFKLLHNPEIGFSERLFWDFGAKLYQAKIRMPLEKLAAKPELYSVMGKINADTLAGMKVPATLMAIKQMERLQPMREGLHEGTVFPKANHVEQLNILYGDYLSDGMMEGEPVADELKKMMDPMRAKPRKSLKGGYQNVTREAAAEANARTILPSSTLTHSVTKRNIMQKIDQAEPYPEGMTEMKTQVLRDLPMSMPDPPPPRVQLDMNNHSYNATLSMRKTVSAPNLIAVNKGRVKERSDANVHLNHILNKRQPRQTPFLNDGQEVFIYSGQKFNCVEKQKAWMRESMSTQQAHTMYSYAPAFASQDFQLTEEGAESGKRGIPARCPTDTYARQEGDDRDVWRNPPARPKEQFRKPATEVSAARADELHEPHIEGEWFKLPIGDARHKPTAVQVRYEPTKIPHHRRITERPFDRAQITVCGEPFGPKSMLESVHYHAHGAPGDDRNADVAGKNVTARDEHRSKIMGNQFMRTFSQGATRRGVTDTDREELILKDPATMVFRGSGVDDKLPTSIRIFEPYHAVGNPNVEFQARMRENDSSAPFDVATGGYIARDHQIGMKLAHQSGTLRRAPWRHEAGAQPAKPKNFEYVSHCDFNATRMPGKSIHNESHVWKNASRTSLGATEKSALQYRRPKDYGVQIPSQTVY